MRPAEAGRHGATALRRGSSDVITVLIVDDEEPARRKVRAFLEGEADFTVIGEAADGEAAVEAIGAAAPDVVLLDIQMPRLDGFGVIERVGLDRMPLVVFITAYDEHALRAFEIEALDYLLKPFSAKRFAQVVERVRKRTGDAAQHDLARRFERLLDAVRPARHLTQILVEKARGREILLRVEHINRIIADGNYLRFLTADGEYLKRGVLSDLEERLDPSAFLRINRSEIVRLEAVAEFQPWFHGDYRVRMKDGSVLTWSRRYRTRRDLDS